ncbi:helix-turn-helix domain-containing protein [Streptomyces ziwulingensis]|uniref:Helix-turn-helix domain-containing protein n=1 Tax=Streptomyces ziwulingensis TaxID=1045501 RepID=A0ABP9CFN6_9ACTN
MTQAQLGARVGVSRETVRGWETGRSTPAGREREAYAKLLNAVAREKGMTAGQGTTRPAQSAQPAQPAQPGSRRAVVVAKPGGAVSPAVGTVKETAQEAAQEAAKGAPQEIPQEAAAEIPEGTAEETPEGTAAALTPAQAFDALYAFCAPALVRQTYLLTGRRELARESVERAFQLAWERWPEVARDRDPASWVRAAAYEFAVSPWHRFRLRFRHPEPPAADAADRVLMAVLLRLPPSHRRTLLLYDGVGLGLPETAAETEATTPAAANRLMGAREAVAAHLPELADPEALHHRLAELASTERLRAAQPSAVRLGSERRARFWTRAAIAFTVALIGSTALTLRTAPTKYEPPVPAGETVRGVPPRMAPGALSEAEQELRAKLREELQDGPERLVPLGR